MTMLVTGMTILRARIFLYEWKFFLEQEGKWNYWTPLQSLSFPNSAMAPAFVKTPSIGTSPLKLL